MDLDRLRASAHAGHLDAMAMLARAYEQGLGVPKDKAEARRWLQLAAAGGLPSCFQDLAETLDPSSGLCEPPGDAVEAEHLYQQAITGGHMEATYPLGRLLLHQERLDEALLWLEHAAARGSTPAMRRIAMLFEQGRQVPANPDLAETWYHQAAALGDDLAKTALRRLARRRKRT